METKLNINAIPDGSIGKDKFTEEVKNSIDNSILPNNLKTINGESIVGEGDIEINTNVDLSNYATKEELNNKQDILTSGTNIKTINGNSILGEGDIIIESGSSNSSAYPEINHGTSNTTFTLTPNTFHVWDEVTSLDLSFGEETEGIANEFLFQFTSGATATTLILPDTIKWANEEVPTIEPNMIYQVSILKGLASCLMFLFSIPPSFPLIISDENINGNYLDVYNYLVSTYELTNADRDTPDYGISIEETINITATVNPNYKYINGIVKEISLYSNKILLWTDASTDYTSVYAISSNGVINEYVWD